MIDDEENDEVTLPVPVLDDNGIWDGLTIEETAMIKSEYFDQVLEFLEKGEGSYTILEALDALGVCPASFVDLDTMQVVALESDAATYHVLPSGGGIFDETKTLMEIFRAVRRARSDFYIWQAQRRPGGSK